MDYIQFISKYIEDNKSEFIHVSDKIWEYAEPRFCEHQSSSLQMNYMKKRGFRIKSNLAGEETAFIAEFGSGKPVIAFLGEFDSLSGLSQVADSTKQCPIILNGEGHGCGHNLLGTASLAATVALKEYMLENNIPGSIRYYGCPAEENAGGKAYLVRDGYFDDCDIALTWHPSYINKVANNGSLSNFRVFFTFHGISAHAAGAPHLGRSALDAVELMNVGVNYMREHMIDEARVHYAITNSGGTAPNVVQSEAQVLYAIRAPKVHQVKELYDRVCKIAQGAALMTETTVEIKQVAAYSDYIANPVVSEQLEKHLNSMCPIDYTKEELNYAQKFKEVITDLDKNSLKPIIINEFGKELGEIMYQLPILTAVAENDKISSGKGSTDVGDVSWVVPTGQINVTCWAAGTAGHSWQAVAQGKSSIAHKGLLTAAKIMAMAGFDFLIDPDLVSRANEKWLQSLDGQTYPNPLPSNAKPEIW